MVIIESTLDLQRTRNKPKVIVFFLNMDWETFGNSSFHTMDVPWIKHPTAANRWWRLCDGILTCRPTITLFVKSLSLNRSALCLNLSLKNTLM